MKKRMLILLGVVAVLSMTGCFDKKKTMKCTRSDKFTNYSYDFEAEIKYYEKSKKMISLKEKGYFYSDDDETLDYTMKINDIDYGKYMDTKFSNYSSYAYDGKATVELSIDFNKVSGDEFKNLYDSNIQFYDEDNKINSDKFIEYYKSQNYECK